MATLLVSMMSTTTAVGSQGPGAGLGTASPLIQQLMMTAVYGSGALILVAGLVQSLRRRR